jgi:nucleoside-diphosphate-sugar epimerase
MLRDDQPWKNPHRHRGFSMEPALPERAIPHLWNLPGQPRFNSGVETFTFDLSDWSKIERLCQAVNPTVIVHAAAYSNPDYCELHHKEALTLNTFATRELAKAANRLGCRLIYTSTDFVFDGKRGGYSEADDPAPINYYGKTKFLGELEITNHCSHYVALRIGTLYGRGNGIGPNCFETMEKQLLAGRGLPVLLTSIVPFSLSKMRFKPSANSLERRVSRACSIWEDLRKPAGSSLPRSFAPPLVHQQL